MLTVEMVSQTAGGSWDSLFRSNSFVDANRRILVVANIDATK